MTKHRTSAILRQSTDTHMSRSKRANAAISDKTFYSKDTKIVEPTKTKSRPVNLVPKTINQERYIMALLDAEIDVAVVFGPAGTGKTYLALLAAIKALKANECKRIVLTRPAVAVEDEKHGFLPGDLNSKMEPWTRPALDVLREFFSGAELQTMLDDQVIEMCPLGYMRGRTFNDSWIILDEAQNSTPEHLLMLLTRIGTGSKIVINGDVEQSDRKNAQNGLLDLQHRLQRSPIDGVTLCEFGPKDVQRHRLIPDFLKLYS